MVDWFALGLLLTPIALSLQWAAPEAFTGHAGLALYLVVGATYFGALESRWGASVGKTLCGLRVVGPDREKPGLWRALARGGLFVFGLQFVNLLWAAGITIAVLPAASIDPYPPLYLHLFLYDGVNFDGGFHKEWFVGMALLFAVLAVD